MSDGLDELADELAEHRRNLLDDSPAKWAPGLNAVEEAMEQIEILRHWKAEAMEVLSGWDKVYAALDPEDAPLGEMRSSIAQRAVRGLKDRVSELELAVALHRRRVEGYVDAQPVPMMEELVDADLWAVLS